MRYRCLLLLAGLLVTATASAGAQSRGGKGFLFGPPTGSVTLRGGLAIASASSDLFAFTTNELTLNRRDFSGPLMGADVAFRMGERFDLELGAGYAGTTTPSEFRKFVDQQDRPINQSTTFRRVPLTASVKAYLVPRGRSIGRFAWIPTRIAPYVGAGAGATWYEFTQTGDFIDQTTSAVFPDTFRSSGWTPSAQTMAGFELSLSPRFALVTDGRYSFARANLNNDFSGFKRIDLSGFATTLGLNVRF
jgi:hypothetical protein